ncbi:MAG: hypothetical protein CMJ06_03980 [Pelagibacterales bacterium]|nr:hypothetical protein [Pelagibacterales bacterium]OUU62170.1 MAG: hypothetical protein CBC22_05430 [Alphaproteobacteria bacterium TMED62]
MLVGITAQKIKHPTYNEMGYYINEKWQLLSRIIGIKLIMLTSLDTTEDLISNKTISAIILSGGGNLSASFPRSKNSNEIINNIDLEREKIEKKLLDFSLSDQIPLLGVCRGMQAVGKYFGAKLIPVTKHVNTRHKLNYFCPIVGEEINKNVNSYHDFGFSLPSIPSELDIIASHMNVIEKFVHKEKKIVGIMWHPEREENFCSFDIGLIKRLFNL